MKKFIICSNYRSGGQYLCSLLASNELMEDLFHKHKKGAELLNASSKFIENLDHSNLKRLSLDLFNFARRGDISGFKVHPEHINNLLKKLNLGEDQLKDLFPPEVMYIWLKRREKERRAISFLIAKKSKKWFLEEGSHAEEFSGEISNLEIKNTIKQLEGGDLWWAQYFSSNEITPLKIYYEDLVKNPKKEIKKILLFLDYPLREISTGSFLKKQSSLYKESLLKEYMSSEII